MKTRNYCWSRGEFMFYSWIPLLFSTFSFAFLLFSVLVSPSEIKNESQVGLEVAHPGVSNDFNDEGENSLRLVKNC